MKEKDSNKYNNKKGEEEFNWVKEVEVKREIKMRSRNKVMEVVEIKEQIKRNIKQIVLRNKEIN
jgi:hypothetical protein